MKRGFSIMLLTLLLAFCLGPPALGAEQAWQSVLYQGAELNDVRNIVPTDNGYWVCTKGGLYFVSNAGQVEIMFTDVLQTAFVYDIAMDANGDYYVTQGFTYAGGVNYGLLHISSDGELLHQYTAETSGLSNDFVQAVEVDSEGNIWIGSGGGLDCFQPEEGVWKNYSRADGLPSNAVNTIVADGKGGLWLGCYPNGSENGQSAPFDGGYAYIDDTGKITGWHFRVETDEELNSFLLSDFWARGIAVDKEGGAYIVRSGSAALYYNSEAYLGADGKPIDIAECVGGRLDYISGDHDKVEHYTGRALSPAIGDSFIRPDRENGEEGAISEIRVVAVDGTGHIWLGSSGTGVLSADAVNGEYTAYNSAAGDFDNAFFDNVWALAVLPNGDIAAGSQGGLRVFSAAKESGDDRPTVGVSTHQVEINGQTVRMEAYNINGNNFYKLRDLAAAMNGTNKQFDISFDAAGAAISISPGQAYTPVGGELLFTGLAGHLEVGLSTHKLLLNGKEQSVKAYNINGNNFFMLRDIGLLLDFHVGWDTNKHLVIINTGESYDE